MNIALFNTIVGSGNIGDQIIMDSLISAIPTLFENSFTVQFATHLHNFGLTSYKNNPKVDFSNSCDYKFIIGTDLLSARIAKTFYQWPIGPISSKLYENTILVGVGTTYESLLPSLYSKLIYNKILRKDIIHSVRDEFSARFLSSMGFKVLNTGCPSIWRFTPSFCESINPEKQKNVIISLSGNRVLRNPEADKQLLFQINKLYECKYFWIQTIHDEKYLNSLMPDHNYTVLYSLKKFSEVCENGTVDYIGTRLHGGIFALQHRVRAFIIAVDHRAIGFRDSFNLNVLERKQISELPEIVLKDSPVQIKINIDAIAEWCSQFGAKCIYF